MKYKLLGAVSTIALGAAFGLSAPGAANAGLTCTGSTTTGTCTETDHVTATAQDFTNISIPVDYFANNVISGPIPTGALTSVSYAFGDNIKVSGTLTNSGSGTAVGSFAVTTNTYTFSGGTPSNFLVPTQAGTAGFFQSAKVTLTPGQKTPFSTSKLFTSGTFTPGKTGYSNTGQFDALVSTTTTGGAVASPANFTATEATVETAFVTITYNYTTAAPPPPPGVPEPASMALLGVGLAGLGAIRRRRKA